MISLRDLRDDDAPMLLEWRNDPQVSKYLYNDHTIGAEEHARWFGRALAGENGRYWIIQVDGTDVGLVSINDIDERNSRCTWAFYVASPAARGRGVGSFVEYSVLSHVFDEMGMHRLWCEVLGFNEPVVEMHRKFGFRDEGRLRQHRLKGDTWHDVVVMGMLRSEWEERKPELEASLRQKGILPEAGGS